MLVATALLIIGLVLLVYGADRLVFSIVILCHSVAILPLIIGITVVGIGTSLPELIVSFPAATHGQMDIAPGTAIGSNITNILLILGGLALLHLLTVHSNLIRRERPLMLLVTLLCGIILSNNQLSRHDGLALIAIAAVWLLCTIKIARRAGRENSDSLTCEPPAELPRNDVGNAVALLGLAVALIVLPMLTPGVIDNATVIADDFGLREQVITLTMISVGTSLPKLATVIAEVLKGKDDIAIGNLIGSNIYNRVTVLGIPALMYPGSVDASAFTRGYWVMPGVSALFTLICLQRRCCIGRLAGSLLLCGFIIWVGMLYAFPSVIF